MYNFKQLQEANGSIKTANIQGKEYAEVNQRIKAFRSICPGGTILTELISCENGVCVFKATVYDEQMKLLGSGHAYEKEGSSFINKTSYIENCETSAVGRALGMCGFGIDTSIASSEEVQNAILNQGNHQNTQHKKTPREMLILRLKELGIDVTAYAKANNLTPKTDDATYLKCLKELENA